MVFYNDNRETGAKKSPLYKQKAVVKISMRKKAVGGGIEPPRSS